MAGLVPAIHVLFSAKEDVDARHKAGHDGVCVAATDHYAGALATATKIVQTSLVRLTISRLSFGPM